MAKKIQPNGIEKGGSQFGTTFCHSEPAQFRNTGASQKKKGSGGDTIQSGPHGTTFVENGSHISMPNADRAAPRSKTVADNKPTLHTSANETAGDQTASQKPGAEGPTQRKYPLARGYEKSGKTDKRSQKIY